MYNKLKEFHDAFKNLKMPDNYEAGAQVNVIESISVDGVNQPVKNKNVALSLTDYAKKTALNVLTTTPSTVEGKVWFEFENHQPVLKIFYGGEVFTLGGAASYSEDGIYYFSRTGTNLIADLQPDNMIILEDELALVDAKFVTHDEYKDLVLTLSDGVTATVRTTTAAALEHLDTQGRTLTFVDNDERRHPVTFYSDGRAVEGKSIMLTTDFAGTTFDAGTFTTVKAVQSPISIQGGTVASALIGGSGNDTLAGNSGNDTLTGGAGSDLFAVKLTGDNVITDFDAASDRISLVASDISNAIGMSAASGGLTLEFKDGSLMLEGFAGGTVTVNGAAYIVEDSVIYNADRSAVTFFDSVTVDLASEPYANISTVNAAGGGSIKAGSSGVVMTGNGASLTGGAGADTFLFNGNDITISNYASDDKVSLAAGYTLATYSVDPETSQVRLTINDAQGNIAGYITFDGLSEDTDVELWQTPNSATEPEVITEKFAQMYIFSVPTNPRASLGVTVKGSQGDFGVIGSPNGTATYGTEYYTSLKYITLTRANSTVIGNCNANDIYIAGGENNLLTGGLNTDTYIFKGGGGVITDFGIGALNDASGNLYATSTKSTNYNRTNPLSYAEGSDVLKVDGTITKIAYDGFGDSTTKNNQYFTATVHYTDDDEIAHTIELRNIVKPNSKKVYYTDDSAVPKLNLWDTSTGASVQLTSTKIKSLCGKN